MSTRVAGGEQEAVYFATIVTLISVILASGVSYFFGGNQERKLRQVFNYLIIFVGSFTIVGLVLLLILTKFGRVWF